MIYDFSDLKIFVKQQLGVDPDKISSKFTLVTEKLTKAQLDKHVDISSSGITFTDKNGKKHKGFLYIESGYSQAIIDSYGTRLPKFHILNCKTIQDQKTRNNFNGHYVFSNGIITMEEIDGTIKELILCGNCHALHSGTRGKMKTSEFVKEFIQNNQEVGIFSDNELPKEVSTNFWGYTHDWDEKSKNYRMNKKFTCEDCGINLNQNLANGFYLETHHIDGNPLNNHEDNLKCLCILCHANSNNFHRENYTKGSNRKKLADFIKLFEDDLIKCENKYISNYKR